MHIVLPFPTRPHTHSETTATLGRTDRLSPDLLQHLLLSRWNGADTNDANAAVGGVGGGGLRGRLLQVLSEQSGPRSEQGTRRLDLLARCPESDSSYIDALIGQTQLFWGELGLPSKGVSSLES